MRVRSLLTNIRLLEKLRIEPRGTLNRCIAMNSRSFRGVASSLTILSKSPSEALRSSSSVRVVELSEYLLLPYMVGISICEGSGDRYAEPRLGILSQRVSKVCWHYKGSSVGVVGGAGFEDL